jgi:Uma2 family endonuclease
MVTQVTRRLFTVAEYYRMAEAGILSEDDRVELIEGEIVEMSPISSRHASCVARSSKLLTRTVGDEAFVWVQNPIHLSGFSEPEPDLALLRPRDDFYAESHPTPDDVLLIIEVAETSQRYDRDVKLPLYARYGIPEFWLVDLMEKAIYVYRQPSGGTYREVQRLQRGESLAPQMLPELTLSVDAIMG